VRRPFTVQEDVRLLEIINRSHVINWDMITKQIGGRSARQCRERWLNYLNPQIRSDPWTEDEDRLLLEKINELGHCWASICHFFNGRSESDVKNRWYSHLKYRSLPDPLSGRLRLVTEHHVSDDHPERKKRNRVRTSAQETALHLLEKQRTRLPLVEPILPTLRPRRQPPSADASDPDIVDFWDQNLIDTVAEDKFDIFSHEAASGHER
jgi:hypothetical protein